jgi:hypothetical protein
MHTGVTRGLSKTLAIANPVFDAVNRSYRVVAVSDATLGVPIEYGQRELGHSLSLDAVLASEQILDARR